MDFIVKLILYIIYTYTTSILHFQYINEINEITNEDGDNFDKITSLGFLPMRILINMMIISILVTILFILFKMTLSQLKEQDTKPNSSNEKENSKGNVMYQVLQNYYNQDLEIYNIFLGIFIFNILYFACILILFRGTKVLSFKKLEDISYLKSFIHYYFTGYYFASSIIFWNPPNIIKKK